MQVKIIGSHGGVSPGFNTISFLIDDTLLIDAGSVATGIPISEQAAIGHIFISHPHLDHIKDLAFLCDNCFGMKASPFEVYSGHTTVTAIKIHLMNDYIWPDFTVLPSAQTPTLRFNVIKPLGTQTIGPYRITPVLVNHPCDAFGYIVETSDCSLVFTQDTGPTEEIWKMAKTLKNLKGIFTEVSFPNRLQKVAIDSHHHTPRTLKEELGKMPKNIPIYLGHLKPNFQEEIYKEILELANPQIHILGSDNFVYVF